MQTAHNINLQDNKAPAGFKIETKQDMLNALLYYPYFSTVLPGLIVDAVEQAATDGRTFKDIKDFAEYLATNYI